MDCKKVQKAISELNEFDERLLNEAMSEHIARCDRCKMEFDLVSKIHHNLKNLKPADPGNEFWKNMTREIQLKLMMEGLHHTTMGWWLQKVLSWIMRPTLAYGMAAAGIVFLFTFWGLSLRHQSITGTAPAPPSELSSPTTSSTLVSKYPYTQMSDDFTLDNLSKEELRACIRNLVYHSFKPHEIENLAGGAILPVSADTSLENDLSRLDSNKLKRLSYMLGQKYQR